MTVRYSVVFPMTVYRLHNELGNLRALKLSKDGAIGDPQAFSSMFSFSADPDNHRLQASHWGGPLQDKGIHCLNAVRHVFEDEPTEVSAARNSVDDPRFSEVEESIAATLMFPPGRIGHFIASFGAEQLDGFRVAGKEGEIAVESAFDFQTPTTVRLKRGRKVVSHQFPQTDQFAGQTAYFSECMLQREAPEADGEEGLANVAILIAVEKTAQTGKSRPINLKTRSRHPSPDMARIYKQTATRLML